MTAARGRTPAQWRVISSDTLIVTRGAARGSVAVTMFRVDAVVMADVGMGIYSDFNTFFTLIYLK